LGACDKAPALMIDGQLYTDLDAEKFDKLIEQYS
jgi:NADH:ubiquinone oxidoreductase subunit E